MTVTTDEPTLAQDGDEEPPRQARLRRRGRGDALVGGVCGGVADYLEIEPLVVRVLFVVIVVASGVGLVIYPLAWALIPGPAAAPAAPARTPWRARLSGWREAVGIAVLVVGAVLALHHAGLWLSDRVIIPLVLASSGLALILRTAVGDDWVPGHALRGESKAARDRRRRHWAAAIGAALVIGAAVLFLHDAGILPASGRAIAQAGVIVIALSLVVGPALARLARSLATERSQRIRTQERAEVAAHLHDSVLQTLALIQRRAGDPREVARLARSQERELRRWLFEPRVPGEADTLASALTQIAAEVEVDHGVVIEVVTVGDCAMGESLTAMVAAAREALTNAAKFAGEDQIDLYAEAGEERVEVFVRDHGPGFDPEAIPADRGGVRRSIVERMARHGGHAEVKAQPGQGTEIELVMERR